jgi:hypothetical protein
MLKWDTNDSCHFPNQYWSWQYFSLLYPIVGVGGGEVKKELH